jgi:hypothetical protein
MQFLGHSRNPQVSQSWVIHELCVLDDHFFCDRMDDTIADLFNVDIMLKPVCGVIELHGDGVTGQTAEHQVDYMVEGMDGNAGRPLG